MGRSIYYFLRVSRKFFTAHFRSYKSGGRISRDRYEDQSTLARTSDIRYVILIYICYVKNICEAIGQSAELVTFTARDVTRFVLSLGRKYYDLYRKFIFVNFPDVLCCCYCQRS